SQFLHLTISETLFPSHSAHEPAYNLSRNIIDMLYREYDPDYILTLDNYQLSFDQDVVVEEFDDGSKSKTAHYDLVLNTYSTIYNIHGQVVKKILDELRILHDSRPVLSGLFAVGPSMGKADENVVLISDELGRKFIHKFYPINISEMRPFYHTKEFAVAYQAYRFEDWAKVEKELLELANSPDRKISGRAAYNLSVLYENLNKRSEMENWYYEAVEKLGSGIPYNIPGY
ncbi:DUF6340 family protein, partial [Bacteroidota bacterium]